MGELTLESLAKRVEELERRVGVTPPGATPLNPPYFSTPGKGNLLEALEDLKNLSGYNFGALAEQDAVDIEDAKRRCG